MDILPQYIKKRLINCGTLTQIDENRYDADMTEAGIQNILKFGIAFSEKKVSVKTK